jgi:hypothetical protein
MGGGGGDANAVLQTEGGGSSGVSGQPYLQPQIMTIPASMTYDGQVHQVPIITRPADVAGLLQAQGIPSGQAYDGTGILAPVAAQAAASEASMETNPFAARQRAPQPVNGFYSQGTDHDAFFFGSSGR